MRLIVNGQRKRFISAMLGDKPITEIWLGDRKIWPDPTGVARRLVVELPKPGTLDWQYWVHAVDATKEVSSQNNYMKFTVDGEDFFLNSTYRDMPPYKLEGDVISLDGYDGAYIDSLGTHLEIEAVINQRYVVLSGVSLDDEERTLESQLPLLNNSRLECQWWTWHSGKDSFFSEKVTSLPSGTLVLDSTARKSARRVTIYGLDRPLPQIPASDTGWNAVIKEEGDGVIDWYRAFYPSFKKTFKLRIISAS